MILVFLDIHTPTQILLAMFNIKLNDEVWVVLMVSKKPEKAVIYDVYGDGCYLKPQGIYVGNRKILGYVDL